MVESNSVGFQVSTDRILCEILRLRGYACATSESGASVESLSSRQKKASNEW